MKHNFLVYFFFIASLLGCESEEISIRDSASQKENVQITKWIYGGGRNADSFNKHPPDDISPIDSLKQLWTIQNNSLRNKKDLPHYFESEFFINSQRWKNQNSTESLAVKESILELMKWRNEFIRASLFNPSKITEKEISLQEQITLLSKILTSNDLSIDRQEAQVKIIKALEEGILKITDEFKITSNLTFSERVHFIELLKQIIF